MQRLDAIDLFSGAGGLSVGLDSAGWRVMSAFDNDADCCATHCANILRTPVVCDDVQGVKFRAFRGVDLIAGGPPCQPFSVAGHHRARRDDRDMIPDFVRAVREARPVAFMMENVPGLATPRNAAYLAEIIGQLTDIGYTVHHAILDAADFGVPQHRRRLFLVGVPRNVRFSFPLPTHGPGRKSAHIAVRRALAAVPLDEPNRAIVTYAKNPVLRRSPWAGLLLNGKGRPLNPNAPSLTIPATAGGNRTHILDPAGVLLDYHRHLSGGGSPRRGLVQGVRRLTVRESARLQSFPDGFAFHGARSSQYRQVGNAVPPLLAKAVAAEVREALQRRSRSTNHGQGQQPSSRRS
jgi:DNA (cytosine-5)-methyltransferase 1